MDIRSADLPVSETSVVIAALEVNIPAMFFCETRALYSQRGQGRPLNTEKQDELPSVQRIRDAM